MQRPKFPSSELKLFMAAKSGKVKRLIEVFRENKTLKINWQYTSDNYKSALYEACDKNHDKIVALLLCHPDIDVNDKTLDQNTALMKACLDGFNFSRNKCAKLLINDHRLTTINHMNANRSYPMLVACHENKLDLAKAIIATGKNIILIHPGSHWYDCINEAKSDEMKSLLTAYNEDQSKTIHQVRKEIGWYNERAAELFALVVFLCDGLLKITKEKESRFFSIISRVPLEIQMILCYRVIGIMKTNIPTECKEQAFKNRGQRESFQDLLRM